MKKLFTILLLLAITVCAVDAKPRVHKRRGVRSHKVSKQHRAKKRVKYNKGAVACFVHNSRSAHYKRNMVRYNGAIRLY